MADRKLEKLLESKKRLEEKLRQKDIQNLQKDEAEYQRKSAIVIQKMNEASVLKEQSAPSATATEVSIKALRESLTKSHYFSADQKRAEREETRQAQILSELHLTASVTINVHYQTEYGESLFVSGSTQALGKWERGSALPMTWKEGHIWTITFDHPRGIAQFRFLMKDDQRNKTIRVEEGDVHEMRLESQSKVTLNEIWHCEKKEKGSNTPSPLYPLSRQSVNRKSDVLKKNGSSISSSAKLTHFNHLNTSLDHRRGANMNEDSHFSLLSDEIILNILKHFSVPDLLRVSCVCWALNEIASDMNLWRSHFLRADSTASSKIDEKNVNDWRALAKHRICFQKWEENATRVENEAVVSPCGSGKVFVKQFTGAESNNSSSPHLLTAVGSGTIRSWKVRNVKREQGKETSRKVPSAMLWGEYFTPFDAESLTAVAADKNIVVASDSSRFYYWNFRSGEYLKSSAVGVPQVTSVDVRGGVLAASSSSVDAKATCSFFRANVDEIELLGKPLGCLQAIRTSATPTALVTKPSALQWKFFPNVFTPPKAVTDPLICATLPLQHFGTDSQNLILLSASLSLFDLNRLCLSSGEDQIVPLFSSSHPLRPYRAISRNGNIVGGVHFREKHKCKNAANPEVVLELFDSRNNSSKPIVKRVGLSQPSSGNSNLIFDDVRCFSCIGDRVLLWDLRINRPPVARTRGSQYESSLILNDHLLLPKWDKPEGNVENVVCKLQTLSFPVIM